MITSIVGNLISWKTFIIAIAQHEVFRLCKSYSEDNSMTLSLNIITRNYQNIYTIRFCTFGFLNSYTCILYLIIYFRLLSNVLSVIHF